MKGTFKDLRKIAKTSGMIRYSKLSKAKLRIALGQHLAGNGQHLNTVNNSNNYVIHSDRKRKTSHKKSRKKSVKKSRKKSVKKSRKRSRRKVVKKARKAPPSGTIKN